MLNKMIDVMLETYMLEFKQAISNEEIALIDFLKSLAPEKGVALENIVYTRHFTELEATYKRAVTDTIHLMNTVSKL